MDYQMAHSYLSSRPEAVECFPFGIEVAVFKVKQKMFATLSVEGGVARTNLKCDPQEALALRDVFAGVLPGYHMNKKHWNTVLLDGSVPAHEIERMMDRSYGLVVKGLPKIDRSALELAYGVDKVYR
ncbi:MAG: MmcQ/YjbR family DNA-binding protein [Gammaproteobacteria bacterium]|nr:MmcQ/YjbR family DNA-binding protein [Gammaproteobacteria bacterium]